MSAPRIERGPMVAEVLERDYTRVGNRLIRDPEISYKAKGIFIYLASHRDGFGVSPESIAAAGRDGISAVKSALRELEQRGYLARSQARTTDGTMGQTVYRITDMPSSEPLDGNHLAGATCEDGQHGRSGPVDGNPLADDPSADDRPHKKTIPLQEDQLVEDELSLPPVPAQRTVGSAPAEREIVTSIDRPSTAQQVVRAANLLTSSDDETAFITWAAARYRIRSGALWRTVAANGDLSDWVAAWRAEGSQAVAYGLTGTDATVKGWLDLADQLGGRRPHQPYRNDAWALIEAQAAAGGRPDGWERVAHCGHLDCDEITRMRETEDGNGLRSLTYCQTCHPALQF